MRCWGLEKDKGGSKYIVGAAMPVCCKEGAVLS